MGTMPHTCLSCMAACVLFQTTGFESMNCRALHRCVCGGDDGEDDNGQERRLTGETPEAGAIENSSLLAS